MTTPSPAYDAGTAIAGRDEGAAPSRLAGPLLRGRVTVPAPAERLFADAATVLLVALAATSALTAGHGFAGWARPAGVLVAGLLAARRAPFPVVVIACAGVTALLRLAGVR